MRRYEKYKDSGIEWIGEIPEHWESIRLKYIGYLYGGLAGKSANDFNQESNFNNKSFIPFTNICNNKIIDPNQLQQVVIEEKEQQNKVEKGDLFFMMSSENFDDVGKSSILLDDLGETYLNSFCKGFRFTKDKYYPPFINYQLLSKAYRSLVLTEANGYTRINLKIDKINDIPVKIPSSLDEQIAIAKYLDQKTTEIEELINQKEELLLLFEEEKTGIINNAVIKGINPNAKLKDSKTDWLGEIPEHWKVTQFRRCITTLTDFTANGSFASLAENVNYLTSGYSRLVRLTDLRVNFRNDGVYVDEHAHAFLKKSELFGGEILLANVGAYAGYVTLMPLIEGIFTLGPNMFLIRINQNPNYFAYMLNSANVNSQLKNIALSSAQPKLNKDDIKQLEIVLPPIEEQHMIAQYIDIECKRIDAEISKIHNLINLLKEYKTALISEVATGKVKVN